MPDKKIINAHAHCFTADHVPPFLAKTYLPWGLHFLIPLNVIVACFRFYNKKIAPAKYGYKYKKWIRFRTTVLKFLNSIYPARVLIGYYLFFLTFFMVYKLIRLWFTGNNSVPEIGEKLYAQLDKIFLSISNVYIIIAIVIVVFLMLPAIRNTILMLLRLIWKPLTKIPGPKSKDLVGRYLNIGRYAFHLKQKTIVSILKSQYPKGTTFVLLPMDMDYMAAGNAPTRYRDQMEELAELYATAAKNTLYPFVFADPRRFGKVEEELRYQTGDKIYFDYQFSDGVLTLKDSLVKDYLEHQNFSGIKIYPALGYYPFDEKLLPLWRYAADNQVPIMTHCIRGTIFYRGVKKSEWNQHPVFRQAMKKVKVEKAAVANTDEDDDGFETDEQMETKLEYQTQYVPLVLPQAANVDFSYNFTHPLNYLCLLEEELLRQVIANAVAADPNTHLKEMFGYTNETTTLTNDLSKLKICLAHFGGEDEWKRYFEKDRYSYSSQLIQHPKRGISFLTQQNNSKKPAPGKIEQLWKYGDWYSIICSMMLQYDNLYADISYILHGDKDIMPLLKETLQNEKLRTRVLYGTDFFVVRNHKSDKNMLADFMGGLNPADFDQIAVENPESYLQKTTTN